MRETGVKNEEVHKPVQWAPVLFWELWTQEWKKKKKKTDTEKFFACVEFAMIPEKSYNEIMTKLKNQYKLNK